MIGSGLGKIIKGSSLLLTLTASGDQGISLTSSLLRQSEGLSDGAFGISGNPFVPCDRGRVTVT
jgi:hypothetical protein